MIFVTGNDLKSGAVRWWNGGDWVDSINDAVAVQPDEAAAIIAKEEAAQRINAAYQVEVNRLENASDSGANIGFAFPHIKEQLRATGPSIDFIPAPINSPSNQPKG